MNRKTNVWWAVFCLVVCLLAGAVLPACAFSNQQNHNPFTLEVLPGVSEETADEIRQAAEAGIHFFREQAGLELNSPVRIVLAPDRRVYVAEVRKRFRLSELDAEKVTRGTHALSGKDLVIVDISGIPSIRQKTFLLAHELTHKLQRQIAGNQASQEMWLLEGLAETVGAQVVAQHGYYRIDQYKENWRSGLVSMSHKPGLDELKTSGDWSSAIVRYGSPAVYKTSGLAVLILVERFGQQKVWDYFVQIGRGQLPEVTFQQVFGCSMADFIAEFYGIIREAA